MTIGEKIKNKRTENNYTQEKLSILLHVSRSTVSSWEVGRTYPDLETIVKISEVLDITLDELLKGDTIMTKKFSDKIKKNKYYKITIGVLVILLIAIIVGIFTYESTYRPYKEWYQKEATNSITE